MSNWSKKPPPHFHDPAIGYTNPTYRIVKIMKGKIFILSATAPETIVAAVAANTVWKNKSAAPWENTNPPQWKNPPPWSSPYIKE